MYASSCICENVTLDVKRSTQTLGHSSKIRSTLFGAPVFFAFFPSPSFLTNLWIQKINLQRLSAILMSLLYHCCIYLMGLQNMTIQLRYDCFSSQEYSMLSHVHTVSVRTRMHWQEPCNQRLIEIHKLVISQCIGVLTLNSKNICTYLLIYDDKCKCMCCISVNIDTCVIHKRYQKTLIILLFDWWPAPSRQHNMESCFALTVVAWSIMQSPPVP